MEQAAFQWQEEEILILVKAYPNPSQRYQEACCIAGVTRGGKWVRLYPVQFRMLEDDRQFKKYQWIRTRIRKRASDPRAESHVMDPDHIELLEEIPTTGNWALRWACLRPLVVPSIDYLRARQEQGDPYSVSLGMIRVQELLGLRLTSTASGWTEEERGFLSQQSFFGSAPSQVLEKVPYDFRYVFRCQGECCRNDPHDMKIVDWEIYQSYRKWSGQYGSKWKWALRKKYEEEMRGRDLHLFVGTVKAHPSSWIVVGLCYPPRTEAVQQAFGS